MKNYIFILLLIGQNIISIYGSFNFFLSSIPFLGPALYASFDKLICSYTECCPGNNIQLDLRNLAVQLSNKVHGQPLVKNVVLRALKGHMMTEDPSKALVLSFHGWTGSGKNFVTKFIVETLHKYGMKSKFVHLFVSTVHFPHEDKVDIYKMHIQDWIRGNVSKCEQSVFIFDEIDKMPLGVINAIKPFIDHHEEIDGVNFRKSYFIFLSNTGSRHINQKVITIWKDGNDIDSIDFTDLEPLVQKGAFNEVGGLHNSDVISHNLVDYYVPFLPLQKKHVELCVVDELHKRHSTITAELVKKITDSLLYFPPGTGLFSTTGCKKVSQRAAYYLSEEALAHDFL